MQIPQKATLIDRTRGTANQGQNKGKHVTVSLWQTYASKGYKSNYEAVRTVYSRCAIDGEPVHVWSYSGKNIEEAYEDFRRVQRLIT